MAQFPVEYLLNKLEALVVGEVKLLKGVGDEVDELKMELKSMKSFLKDADRRKDDDEGIKEWVQQVREVAYDIEDALDEFQLQFGGQQSSGVKASFKKVSSSPSRWITRHKLARQMQSFKTRVVSLNERRNRYSFKELQEGIAFGGPQYRRKVPLDEQLDLVGIDQDITEVIGWLTGGDQQLTPISLFGMGGSGKTTLARKVFNHQAVKRHFDCYAWVSVSQSFNVQNILVSCISDFYKSRSEICPDGIEKMDISSLKQMLHSYLQHKRYVLVLDDVWSQNVLEEIQIALPNTLRGSRVMITTRKNDVTHPIEDRVGLKGLVHRLQPLPNETAMHLFCKKAFRDEPQNICPPHLIEVCNDLVKRCDGLPLAIVVLGGIMWRKKKSENEWKIVHDSLSSDFNNGDHPLGSKVGSILSLSIDELPLHLKSCYLYCGVFPEDYLIKTNKLIRLWVAEGLVENKDGITLEEVGKRYLDELIQRSLLQTVRWKAGELGVKSCRIHDLLRELVISTSKNQNFCSVLTKESAGINERIRRLSLQNDSHEGISLSNQSASHLRSLFLFEKAIMPSSFFTMLSSFRLMRVLDLKGILIEELPDALGDLFHLRYLNLSGTNIRRLPSSFGKLHNLQTFDIRETPIKSLPKETSKLKSLHYVCAFPLLKIPVTFKQLVGCEMPKGICMVTDLQKLSGINATTEIVHGIGSLTKLKNLAILMVRREHASHLCASVANMKDLLTLRVAGIGEEEPLQLESLEHPPRRLEDIQIYARLSELPGWIGSLNNLARLELTFSRLSQDPFSSLQSLPNLVCLDLSVAYDGKELRCDRSGGFPKLKQLYLFRLARLENVWVEETAMPKLQILWIIGCKEMKRVPRGIQHINTIRKLDLSEMPEELIDSIRRHGGKDHSMVKHIPEIIVGGILEDGTWCGKYL